MSSSDASSSVPTGSAARVSAAPSAVPSRGGGGEAHPPSSHQDVRNSNCSSSSSSGSTSHSSNPSHQALVVADTQRSRTSSSEHKRPLQEVARDSGSSRPPSRQSTTTTATTATAGTRPEQTRRLQMRAGPAMNPHHTTPQQQQQQQQARPPPLPTSPERYAEADVARVRAALADAGYPNPSRADIERVFEQMAHNTAQADAQLDRRSLTPQAQPQPQQQQQQNSLLHYLDPGLRLERYVQLRERELENMCLRPPPPHTTSLRGATHGASHRSTDLDGEATPQDGVHGTTTTAATSGPLPHGHGKSSSRPLPTRGGVDVLSPQQRRAANIVYNITGDQRFRFFPATRTPQGAGALTASGGGSSSRHAAEHRAHSSHAVNRSRSTASTGSAALTPCRNFYYPQRSALGSGSTPTTGRQHTSSSAAGGGGRGVSVRSSNAVAYLDPRGCTLRHKADPVTRGQQMRVLWERDSFLSQRRRPQQAWRTRQITMAYEPGEPPVAGGIAPASS